MSLKKSLSLNRLLVGFIVVSLCVLPSAQAYTADEGFAYTADGKLFAYVSAIAIDSPTNTTYMTDQVSLNFVVNTFVMGGFVDTVMSYSIDGKDNVTVSTVSTFVPVESTVTYANGTQITGESAFYSYYHVTGSVDITELQPGQHSLTVFGHYSRASNPDEIGFAKQTVYFTIEQGNTINNAHNDNDKYDVTTPEQSSTVLYASVGVLLLVAVVSYALFNRRKSSAKTLVI